MSRVAHGRVAVLMGGRSAEREISLQGGAAVLAALHRNGIDASVVDPADGLDGLIQALSGQWFDCAFIMLHGRGGEDGSIQGLLDTLGIAYTGSGVLGSALAMDKLRSKWVWRSLGLPTPACLRLESPDDCERAIQTLGLPLMVKPVSEGSSIGMSRVDEASAITAAWALARACDDEVIAEQWVRGQEYTVALLNGEALPEVLIETPRAFYDYEAKYRARDTHFQCPGQLSPTQRQGIQRLAREAFDALGCSGWGRVDLMIDDQDRPWLIEVNTVPGMTDHSLVPMAAGAAGMSFDALVMRILERSLERRHGI